MEMKSRLTDHEANAIVTLLMSVGVVSTNGLKMFGISKRRALELEVLEPNEAENEQLRKIIQDTAAKKEKAT